MNTFDIENVTRRHFLSGSGLGLGAIALSSIIGKTARADLAIDPTQPLVQRLPHFAPRAKQVIYLHLTGSPPNLDLYDYKPELVKRDGENCPQTFLAGRTFAFTSGVPKLMGTPHKFAQYGQSGDLAVRRRTPLSGRRHRGRDVLHPLDEHGPVQSRAG